jgi:hypothetical protein
MRHSNALAGNILLLIAGVLLVFLAGVQIGIAHGRWLQKMGW